MTKKSLTNWVVSFGGETLYLGDFAHDFPADDESLDEGASRHERAGDLHLELAGSVSKRP